MAACVRYDRSMATSAPGQTSPSTDDVYALARQLPPGERLRLVEKIAHDLAPAPDVPARPAPVVGLEGEIDLLGQVTDLSLDPPRFTVRTARGPVVVQVAPDLLDAARDAWGKRALVGVAAVVDADGAVHDAKATTIEPVAFDDDPVAIFEATFGSGAALAESPTGREYLETMRGAV